MKRIVTALAILTVSAGLFCGCNSEENLDSELPELRQEVESLKQEKVQLESEVAEKKAENGTANYVVTINVSQTHAIWEMKDAWKDSMNDVDIDIPVSKEFYDSVEVGTVLDDSFRMGSFVMNGSVGSWNITVSDKKIE